jgi:serine/threonine protein kinase
VVKGKFSYMQPEELAGLRPDRRADVWGLGVVMWQMLTGKRLFHGESDLSTLRALWYLPDRSLDSALVTIPSISGAFPAPLPTDAELVR